jgi:hypothetical protein
MKDKGIFKDAPEGIRRLHEQAQREKREQRRREWKQKYLRNLKTSQFSK